MEPPGLDGGLEFPKNPLLCPICHDYFTEPCILSCYHTFCARCLRGREQDRKLICPFCRQPTILKDGSFLPPPDSLMRQLIDIANSENPPCCNCDKRDRANMYYCNTCGQALCAHCRDTTHRAKMFSSHEVVHMTKCQKEPKRCPQHGEHYIMYSPMQNAMLCVNCFRDLPNEVRTQCVDIDTAHGQASKRLERGQNTIMDLQTSVRDGIIALKGLMDELRRNMDAEKHTINTFCQGMQESMSKTHAAMIMEVQRQYDSKDRVYRSQLLLLGTVMPVLQLHLVLCTTFTAAANKYQFLELCPSLVERLAAVGNLSQPVRSLQSPQIKTNYRSEFAQCLEPWIGAAAVSQHQSELAATSRIYDSAPPATKKQQSALKSKILESDSSFSAHCRSFESQIRELNQQFNKVKDKVSELHKDINAIRKAQTPPLTARYELLIRECLHLDQTLERQQQELERMAAAFDQSWEEQLWRLRIEQEVFSCQRADVNTLRNELKHLSQVATQLEPYIRTLTPVPAGGLGGQSSSQAETGQHQGDQAQQLANLLEHIGIIGTLEELSLHQEDIEKIEHINNWCKKLQILYLQANQISKIENLNKLKELQYLNLAINNIEKVENLERCESLEKLDLTLNFIGDLESIKSLKANIHLRDLYLTGNPCCDFRGYREFVIAHLPQITNLDLKEITRSERIKAHQNLSIVEKWILDDQEKHKKFRKEQKIRAQSSNSSKLTDEEFWQTVGENCPETRLEIAKRQKKRDQRNNEIDFEEKPVRPVRLFGVNGRPLNVNQAKLAFTFSDEDPAMFLLDVAVYKYLDTSLIDVDLQPIYVRLTVKDKIFQMVFPEEIQVEKSSALRSQTTGMLQPSDGAMSKIPRSRSRVLDQLLGKVRPSVIERERSKSASQTEKSSTTPVAQKTPKKTFSNSAGQMNIDSMSKLEAQIREKLHDIMCRRQSQPSSKSDTEMDKKMRQEDRKFSKGDVDGIGKLSMKQRILYKKIGKSCDKINGGMADKKCRSVESEYQRISDATSQKVREPSRSSPGSPKCKSKRDGHQGKTKKKVYPYSDGEDNIFYSLHDSADSLSTSSRRSSLDAAAGDGTGPDKTLVVVINRRQKGAQQTLAQKQRSWETFPPKHKRHHVCQSKLSAPTQSGVLKKTDSFEDALGVSLATVQRLATNGTTKGETNKKQTNLAKELSRGTPQYKIHEHAIRARIYAMYAPGHEEAVRSLVAAVQETRRKPKSSN